VNRWRARLAQLDAPKSEVLNTLNILNCTGGAARAVPDPPTVHVQNVRNVQNTDNPAPVRATVRVQNVQNVQNPSGGLGVPRTWDEGFAATLRMAAPPGFSPERWQRIIDAARNFLDRWTSTAIAAGWSDLDVFGCDPDRPDARFDCMGLVLLLDRAKVVGVDERGADLMMNTGARQRFRRRPLPTGTINLWELASR